MFKTWLKRSLWIAPALFMVILIVGCLIWGGEGRVLEVDADQLAIETVQLGEHAILLEGEGAVGSWDVDIQDGGIYQIHVEYSIPVESKVDPQFSLEIDHNTPYADASNCFFPRVWRNASPIIRDSRNNDIKPKQETVEVVSLDAIKSSNPLRPGALEFDLGPGIKRISLTMTDGIIKVGQVSAVKTQEIASYRDVEMSYVQNSYKDADDVYIKLQGQTAHSKSSSLLYPTGDNSSPLTEPYRPGKNNINVIGQNWHEPKQWLAWYFQVPEDGLYQIALKYKQDALQGMAVSRNIYIDGKLPYREFQNTQFKYDPGWQLKVVGDNEPYNLYLEKGVHEIKLEVTMGDLTEVVDRLNEIVYNLNEMYRQIIMITSVNPDPFRDYYIERQIPNLIYTFRVSADEINAIEQGIVSITGKKGRESAVLKTMAHQLSNLADNPETIPKRLDQYKSNVSSIAAWIVTVSKQPLLLDYIIIKSPEQPLPTVQPGFFQAARFMADKFAASFTEDYNLLGDGGEQQRRTVKVWVSLGRDQAQILKDMISDSFTPKTDIGIDLQLVQGSVIEATLAGKGPDVALMNASSQPVNFALRDAIVDLSQFDGFADVLDRFYPSAMEPFKYNGGYYALPETQVYDMLFYRKDVFEHLNIAPPETWDQFYKLIPIIQRKNLEIGFPVMVAPAGSLASAPSNQSAFAAMLFQNGGEYYNDTLTGTAFDSPAAIEAFMRLCDLYIKYDFPISYDFFNRFKTGEMPMAIQPYVQYNMIYMAAPEIRGLWDMVPIPGTVSSDGSISIAQGSDTTGSIMFKNTKDKLAAWEFLKWWTSDETQAEYGLQLEMLMGPGARYATANKAVLEQLPWKKTEYLKLAKQWEQVRGIPEAPGSYYTGIGLSNAFKNSVVSYRNPHQSLLWWNKYINDEIARKRMEFGL